MLAAAGIIGIGCVSITLPAQSDDTAEKTYLPAARKGDALAQFQLALAYRYGTAGMRADPKAAWEWLNKAADGKLREARVMVADALLRGELGQTAQPQQALTLLRELAKDGHAGTQTYLATLLEEGRGFEPQPVEAAHWYEQAARHGYRSAALRLARLLESGRGVAKDAPNAYAWFRLAHSEPDIERLRKTLAPGDVKKGEVLAAALSKEIGQ